MTGEAVVGAVSLTDARLTDVPLTDVPLEGGPAEIRGAIRVERTVRGGLLARRLGAAQWSQIPDDFMLASVSQSAGIRLAFRTAATTLELDVLATKMIESETAPMPDALYELVVDGALVQAQPSSAGNRFVFTFERPEAYIVPGEPDTLRFDGLAAGPKDVELWLPYSDEVELLALRADAPVEPPAPVTTLRWLHHGSSISHGYVATRTTRTWPVSAARASGVELTSVAFSGNAMLDQLTARTMRDAPADVLSVKAGINIVNGDQMRLRVFRTAVHGFLDTIRDGHPDAPLLLISPVFCGPVEHSAGPTIQDPSRTDPWTISAGTPEEVAEGKLSLSVIRAELQRIVGERSQTDPNLHYLDGLELYGAADNERLPMPDNLHPADDVQQLMGERFARLAFGPHGLLRG
ncbi:SGNH/GDSL hydrolase family protein [Leifsonia sp. NPDC058248]|uniref:SGNH/GDSL hydrolase family protein n=1 Tax=Leifsonia sp. NPDC058248 TaxID=3346402 RepID=UPI0036DA089D